MFATPAYAQTATATAPAPGPASGGGGPMELLAGPLPLLVVLMGLMYFMMIRPQQRRAKQHTDMVKAIKRGDTIVMSSGILGKVAKVEDAELAVEIAPTVVVKVVKSMVTEVRTRGEPAPANDVAKTAQKARPGRVKTPPPAKGASPIPPSAEPPLDGVEL